MQSHNQVKCFQMYCTSKVINDIAIVLLTLKISRYLTLKSDFKYSLCDSKIRLKTNYKIKPWISAMFNNSNSSALP